MTRCDHCPADPGTTCLRWTTGHARFCELAATRDDYRRLIQERSTVGGRPVEPTPIDPLSILIDTCPFLASCSCADLRRCLQFGLPAYVSRATCRSCVSEAAP